MDTVLNQQADGTENLEDELELSAFDAVWDDAPASDDDMDLGTADEDTLDGGNEAQDADEGQSQETGEAQETGETNEADGEPGEGEPNDGESEEGRQLYPLTYAGETRQYSLEEVLTFASKGLDYDGLRQDRDSLRREHAAFNDYKAFLTELAEQSGLSVEEMMDKTRAARLITEEHGKGVKLSEADAIFKIQRQKAQAAAEGEAGELETGDGENSSTDTLPAAPKTGAGKQGNSSEGMFRSFVEEYPDVRAENIPKEVWDDCAKTGDLAAAYRRYENRQLKAELERLKLNEKNKDRSTGSRRTAGATSPKDAFDEGWGA